MRVTCPNCGQIVELEDVGAPKASPAAVCPGCRHLFFLRHFPEPEPPEETEPAEPEGAPADIYGRVRQHKRYLFLLIALLLAFIGYQTSQSLLSEAAQNEKRDAIARTALRKLHQAQEAHYAGNGAYAASLEELSPVFKPVPGIVVRIVRADSTSWSATAYHEHAANAQRFDSAAGGLDPDGFPRDSVESQN